MKARTFFSSVAPKVTYSFGAFFDTKFNDNKNNNHYNHNGDEEEDEEESEA